MMPAGTRPIAPLGLALACGRENRPLPKEQAQAMLAAACAERIACWLLDAHAGFHHPAADGQASRFARLRPADIAVLVRNAREAAAVRAALHRRGVASVYLSERASVFASMEAQDLLLWLRAVAAPRDVGAVRVALATRLMDLSLAELETLADDEAVLERHLVQMQQLHGVWQRQGVLAMLRQSLLRFDWPARWLLHSWGERRLTNCLHLAELLQTAASRVEGPHALIHWLGAQITQPGGTQPDSQTLRLESEADLVQVITIHKSKGLEYPVVCLPFASSLRQAKKTDPLLLPGATGRRLVLDCDAAQMAQAERERLREDLRLLYVALTRARHALWLGFAPVRSGQGADCVNEKTALGQTLGGGQVRSAHAWCEVVEAFCRATPGACLQHLDADADSSPCTTLPPAAACQALRPLQPYRADWDKQWGIASYSSLVRGAGGAGGTGAAALLSPQTLRADDEGAASPSVPSPAAAENAAPPPIWHRFARGPQVGNLLHDLLQEVAEHGFAQDETRLAHRVQQRCQLAGRSAREAQDLHQWLAHILRCPLEPAGVALAALETPGIGEMEFWLPTGRLPAQKIDALCHAHIAPGHARPPLAQRELHGMLMGFADLIFCHAGRYWVLDYKSNHLGPDAAAYGRPALERAMLAHRYDVQAALYLLALHRLLQLRGGRAGGAAQLGGALFWFVRGLDAPGGGVYHVPAGSSWLEALGGMLE